ncbi:MAG: response regulator [Deltaproteobacteria bacterium]|nr:MAG: response regulator [Deltaproteobacteria bacterium]TMB35813.1 MAG: response regulator [Deltaproteobacteria bacterium]
MPDRQLSVLVVEDDRDTRELTEEVFRAQGFEVLLADSVSSASKILETFKPAMVLLDIAMPGGDGMGLLRHIKRNASTASIPVLLVTGMPRESLPDDASLALSVLRKPFDVSKLAQLVRGFSEKMMAR